MQWLESGHRRFHIPEDFIKSTPKPLNDFEKSAFDFCHDWLNGKETFTLHTSGSTGVPKEISVTRAQLKASANLTIAALSLRRNQTALVCLDTRYIAGVMMLVRSLEAGMNMILVEPCSNSLEKVTSEIQIDFTALVPLQVETILHSSQREYLSQIKAVLVGGAALNKKIIHELQSLHCQCYATYGMTETLSHIALQKINGVDAKDYFTALPGIELQQDERDCLVIKAPHLHADPIITNDIVELIAPNQFRWVGRADNVINTGGVKVVPEKIEIVIQSLFDDFKITKRFFVAGINDEILGYAVALFIEGDNLSNEIETKIKERLKQTLSRFELPRSVHYIKQFVMTATSKVNKLATIKLLTGK